MDTTERTQLDQVLDYWYLFKGHWRLILILTVVSVAWVFGMTKFVLTRWYQSTAYIRPMPRQTEANELSSIASAALGGGQLGGVLSMAGMDTQAQSQAEEYMSIINGYSFTMKLLAHHHLMAQIESESKGRWSSAQITPYRIYQVMQKRFDCKFDLESGNIVMTFIAPSRDESSQILGFYIEDLQNMLRGREIQNASLAIKSLEQQIPGTGDSLLQQDLYQLLAKQIQRQQLAQVQADMAFSVIDPPVAPDTPYRPKVVLSSVIAGLLMLFAACGGIVVFRGFSEGWADYHRRRAMPDGLPVDSTVRTLEELPPLHKKRSRGPT